MTIESRKKIVAGKRLLWDVGIKKEKVALIRGMYRGSGISCAG